MPAIDGWRKFRLEIRGVLRSSSPLHIGSGRATQIGLDAPVLRDSEGTPYIPGSSIRGVWNHWLKAERPLLGCSQACFERLFGCTPGVNTNDEDKPGRTWLGRLTVESAYVKQAPSSEVRDHLRQDRETGAGAEGAKFDAEVLPEGCKFEFRAAYEGDSLSDSELVLLGEALRLLQSGGMRVGAKSGWGHGAIQLTSPEHRSFDRGEDASLAQWFQQRLSGPVWTPGLPDLAGATPDAEPAAGGSAVSLLTFRLRLNFDGPVLVRSSIPPDAKAVDATFITTGPDNRKYLPGSSLRGVLRTHAEFIAGERNSELVTALFGPYLHDNQAEPRKGAIEIGDGELHGDPVEAMIDHVGLDRILSGAKDGAKFNALPLASPKFDVEIRLRVRKSDFNVLPLWGRLLRDLMRSEGDFWVGAGVSRGYGYLRSAEVLESKFDLVREHVPAGFGEPNESDRPGRLLVTKANPQFADFAPLWSLARNAWVVEGAQA